MTLFHYKSTSAQSTGLTLSNETAAVSEDTTTLSASSGFANVDHDTMMITAIIATTLCFCLCTIVLFLILRKERKRRKRSDFFDQAKTLPRFNTTTGQLGMSFTDDIPSPTTANTPVPSSSAIIKKYFPNTASDSDEDKLCPPRNKLKLELVDSVSNTIPSATASSPVPGMTILYNIHFGLIFFSCTCVIAAAFLDGCKQ